MNKRFFKTFRSELMVAFICIGVIPFVVCCLVLINVFQMSTSNEIADSSQVVSTDVTKNLEEILDSMDRLSERIAGNVKLSQALVINDEEEYSNMIYQELYDKTSSYREYAVFELYDMDGNCKFSTRQGTGKDNCSTYWGILKKASLNPYSLVCAKGGLLEKDAETAISFARVIIPYDRATGFFVIKISKEALLSMFQSYYGARDGLMILDEYMNSVFAGGTAENTSLDRVIRERYLKNEVITADFEDQYMTFSQLEKNPFYVVTLTPRAFTDSTLSSMYRVLFIMAGIILVVSIFISNVFAAGLSKPIRIMREKMRLVRKGDLSVRMDTGWGNEFTDLANSFNHMTGELKEYMDLQVEQQKELNGTQIAMMQAQLNPHFLYNTLDTMKWVAKANHVPELATLVSKLSKILRASISKEQFVTLKSEMELVDSYAEIQKIRFGGRFECTCEYPPELESVIIPKLVLQPIVENSVIHGLANAEDGHIFVEAYAKTGDDGKTDLIVEITDDGCGISDEELEHLNAPETDEKRGHIGVRNVDRIIKLNYGPGYGLKISKASEGGTKVVLNFPIWDTDSMKEE